MFRDEHVLPELIDLVLVVGCASREGGRALISATVAVQACAAEGEMEIDTFPVSSSHGREVQLSKQ
jgi:hypothetical protein